MDYKIKKLTKLIASILEGKVCGIKLAKLVIVSALAVLLLDFTTWQELLIQGLLMGLCIVDFEDNTKNTIE